jgi:hypothetical protein
LQDISFQKHFFIDYPFSFKKSTQEQIKKTSTNERNSAENKKFSNNQNNNFVRKKKISLKYAFVFVKKFIANQKQCREIAKFD